MSSKTIEVTLPCLYLGISLIIFNIVYKTSKSVIDEEFHLRQGLHYCNRRFSEWDQKITTFPGLYIVSCILIPLNFCNVYGLRLVSLFASALNVWLIFKIREHKMIQTDTLSQAIESIGIAILPPLYFFSHLYYTDVLSMTFFLCMYYFWDKNSHVTGGIFAGLSVLVRQTNVMWVILLLGTSFLDELITMYAFRKGIRKKSSISLFNVKTLSDICRSWGIILHTVVNTLKHFYGYTSVVVIFVSFVIANGSIVVGDRSAHKATLHIPQVFYFGVFTLMFGAPLIFGKAKEHVITIIKSWKLYAAYSLVFAIMVGLNTLVHPYLLADNRHYTFYVWNRFYGRYDWFKFIMIPMYIFGLHVIRKSIAHLSCGFQIMFWITTLIVLCSQRLLEVRYFLIPFMIVRINLRNVKRFEILGEIMFNIIINGLTFLVFFNKQFLWTNYTEPQRIIW